jgi:hypothetical protein
MIAGPVIRPVAWGCSKMSGWRSMPSSPDRREQESERKQGPADDVEHHQNGPPRVT